MKLIAETAWHHEGDFDFMQNLITNISINSRTDIIKMHITLNFDEYMQKDHDSYRSLKSKLFNKFQWRKLIDIARDNKKEIMLLLNDKEAINFGISLDPEYIEIHSVCLNDIFLLKELKKKISTKTKIVLGIGGSNILEIKEAINYLDTKNIILMFGFQNYPTIYEDVNLLKIKRVMRMFKNFEFGYADHTSWDNENNELITVIGASSGVSYVEKHVTTNYGEERIDWSSAISIEMFNKLKDKLDILIKLNGNGLLTMNDAEKKYSTYGPMKKAAVLKKNLSNGSKLKLDDIKFIRTGEISDMSQLDIIKLIGNRINDDLEKDTVLKFDHFNKID